MENNISILSALYDRYYIKEGTPEEILSSHWKHYQKKIIIDVRKGEIQSMVGFGFGEFDYHSLVSRVFSWLTITSYLCKLKNRHEIIKLMKTAIPLAKRLGLAFSYDGFRQVCSLSLILQQLKKQAGERLRIINIGDGYGFLSALIKEIIPDVQICLVDLGKILLFQAYYCGKAHPERSHHLVMDTPGSLLDPEADFLYCPAENLDKIQALSFDLAINIASMQEMNTAAIDAYFSFLRRRLKKDNLFYCCNREEKEMPGGEFSKFLSYPWKAEDIHLVDEYCPWHQYFFSPVPSQNGPHLFSFRIPFINYFDGPHLHRLSKLRTEI